MTRLNAIYTGALALWLCLIPLEAQSALRIKQDEAANAILVYREGGKEPILTQVAPPDNRPYLHPIVAPDGRGTLTEYRPSHHLHQTGVFWGLKMVNGRDFFMKWQGDYYRRVSAKVIEPQGRQVKWQTVYDMLGEDGSTVMTETQTWSMTAGGSRYVLDLEWKGEAKADINLGQFYVGGLFVRMPWKPGSRAEFVTETGLRNLAAEQQHAKWADLADQVEGRDDMVHIAVLDHPHNYGFPVAWRVDSQMGFGPNRNAVERRIEKGKIENFRHRLIIYTGNLDPAAVNRAWDEYAKH
jgi:Family of unknown function (DUF6807)